MIELLHEWQKVYKFEETYAQRMYHVPSLMVRIDGTLRSSNADFYPYRIQAPCWGMGFAGLFFDSFKLQRDDFKKNKWPEFFVVRHKKSVKYDTDLWVDEIQLDEAMQNNCLILLHMSSKNTELFKQEKKSSLLTRRSVVPCRTQNNKEFGVKLGLWKKVSWEDVKYGNNLPWKKAFVLKPVDSNKPKDVFLWVPNNSESSGQNSVKEALEKKKEMYFQEYVPPIHFEIDKKLYVGILQTYFGFNTKNLTWEPMHGLWMARAYPNLKIDQTRDAIRGPLYAEPQ